MGRLVDVDTVLSVAEGEFSEDDVSKIRWLLSHIETAYDVEEKVAELEKESKEYEKRADENNVDAEYTRYYAISEGLDKAISIIRRKE